MALNLPNIAPANPWSDVVDVRNYLTDKALAQEKGRLENKYLPLNTAIKAQNALSYSNRMGNIGLFLRGIAQMPAAERQAYLADPNNRKNYLGMLDQFKSGINNPAASGNILTPEFMSQFGFGQQPQKYDNPFLNLMDHVFGSKQDETQGQPSNVFQQPQQQNSFSGGQDFGAVNEATPKEIQNKINSYNQQQSVPQQDDEEIPLSPTLSQNEYYDSMQQKNKQLIDDQYGPNIELSKPLSQAERDTLSSQMISNNQAAGKIQAQRADGAATMDKWLLDNRGKYIKAINDYVKYSSLYGKGKKFLDGLRADQPEAYANYKFVTESLNPSTGNQIKFMEHMGATNSQLDEAKNIGLSMDQALMSPDTLRKVINKNIDSLLALSKSVTNVAEPRFKGVRKRLYEIPTLKGDYIPTPEKLNKSRSASSDDIFSPKKLKPGYIFVYNKDGQLGQIPKSQQNEAQKQGYRIIGE